MRKKILITISIFLIIILNTGCWNYIGLNDMTVVAGIAIDKSGKDYLLSIEIYDLQNTTQGEPIKSKIIQCKGKTIFEAVRNAKKRTSNKLYFSEAKILIVSEKIAREEGINSISNWFVRDPEIRETLKLVVSQEKTALALLKTKGLTSTVVSADLNNIVKKDQSITGTSIAIPLYKIFDILNSKVISLSLPAIHLVKNNGTKTCEINGIAVFKKDKLIGYLSSEDTEYFLLAKGDLKKGIITINTKIKSDDKDSQNISFEIKKSSTSQKYISTEVNNLKVKISTSMEVTLGELKNQDGKLNEKDINKLQNEAARTIKRRIENVIRIIQKYHDSDIIGYGDILYRNNPKVWKKVKDKFDKNFKYIDTDVECKVEIYNTGFTK